MSSAELQRRIQAMEMRCYCMILRISYRDHVTNEEVRAKIEQAVGPHEDLLTIVNRRKLQWYGHVSRSSGLAKTILQSTVKGGRRQDRQSKKKHVVKICQTACFELTHISSIRRFLTDDATKTLVTSYILSRLDYCHCLLIGAPNSVIQPRQNVQNLLQDSSS